MAPPKIQWQFSIGNIIQIVGFVIALAIGWATMTNEIANNAAAITSVSNDVEKARGLHLDYDVRLRTLESNAARSDERLNSILTLLARIDNRLERIERTDAR